MSDQTATTEPTTAGVSRRTFLVGSGMAGAAVLVAACGGNDKKSTATTKGDTATTAGGGAGDLTVAKVAAGLEVLAVGTYKAALDAATAGKLGTVPPAVASYVKLAMNQHQAHLEAWNKVLTTANQPAVSAPDAKLKPVVDAQFAQVKDAGGAAKLALMLEDIAAQTYLKAIPTLTDKAAIKLAGSIQIIDQQHQAILLYALGQYPVPEVFQKTDKAAF
ncbi:MAG: ferritin-like domain-containing protein [Actinobacteria bacterium]|nr:ferritin-like domain-containing protein [Actinomycetota bacterium]